MKYIVTLTEDIQPGEIPGVVGGLRTVVVSGCGHHKGTWDAQANSKRTAQRWAKQLRVANPGKTYSIEEAY